MANDIRATVDIGDDESPRAVLRDGLRGRETERGLLHDNAVVRGLLRLTRGVGKEHDRDGRTQDTDRHARQMFLKDEGRQLRAEQIAYGFDSGGL